MVEAKDVTALNDFLIGAGGAAALEAIKLWTIQGKLTERQFRKLLTCFSFWVPLLAMLAASGFLAWVFHESYLDTSPWALACVGITARSLIRETITAGVAHAPIILGGKDRAEDHVGFRDFFS